MATNVYQYSPTKTRSYDSGTKEGSSSPYSPVATDTWNSDTVIRQGSYSYTYDAYLLQPDDTFKTVTYTAYCGPYYGTMFSFRSLNDPTKDPTELAGKTISSARIWLKRYSSGGSSPDSIKIWGTSVVTDPGSGAHSPNGEYEGPSQVIGSLAFNQGAWFNLDTALAQYVISGKGIVVCYGSSNYMKLYGIESASNKPILEITTTIPTPTLTGPALGAIVSVTDNPHTFFWGASSDQGQFFTPGQLFYEMQFSPDGTTWGATQPIAAGITFCMFDLKSALGLQDAQYYYNAAAKIRVRAKTPVWTDGNVYYSTPSATDWTGAAVSSAFTVDYRLTPAAPSLSPSNSSPYEGETVVFTVGLPATATYNEQDSAGNTEGIHYYVQFSDKTAVGDADTDVSMQHQSIALPAYTIGNMTTETSNLVKHVQAYAVTHKSGNGSLETQTSPLRSIDVFTIKRFRAPTIMITGISRTANTAVISLKVPDTGYGGTQFSYQISQAVNNTTDGLNFNTVTLVSPWAEISGSGDFTNSFTISVDSKTAYPSFGVQAVNIAPTATALTGITSATCSQAIYEYIPAFFAWKDSTLGNTHAAAGISTQSLIVGATYTAPVDAGYVVADNGMKVGGNTVWHAGNSAKLGNATSLVTAATAGICGDLMKWDANGNAAATGLALASVTGNQTKAVTAVAAGASGNLMLWDVNGNAADSGISPNGWMACNETWIYTSATTFTVSGNVSTKYQKGDKIIWTQNGSTLYSNIISVSYSAGTGLTTIIKHVGYISTSGDCDLLNTAIYIITNNAYSKWSTPQGFPDWFSWTPAFSCSGSMTISSISTHHALFKIEGSMLFISCSITCTLGGTANNTIYAISPVIIDSSMSGYTAIACRYLNGCSSTAGTGYVKIDYGIYIRRTDSSSWITGSGNEIEFNTFYRY